MLTKERKLLALVPPVKFVGRSDHVAQKCSVHFLSSFSKLDRIVSACEHAAKSMAGTVPIFCRSFSTSMQKARQQAFRFCDAHPHIRFYSAKQVYYSTFGLFQQIISAAVYNKKTDSILRCLLSSEKAIPHDRKTSGGGE